MTAPESVAVPPSATVKPSRPLEIAFAAISLALSSGYLFLATRIALRQEAQPGQIDARFWPLVLAASAVAVSVILLVIAITRPAPGREDLDPIQRGGVLRVALTIVVTLIYVAIWSIGTFVAVGYRFEIFPIFTALYLFALMLLFGQRKWLGLILYPLTLTAFIYAVFGILLRVPL